MTDYDFHRKIAALEKRITRLESGFKELDITLDPEGWVGEAFKLLDQDIEEVKAEIKGFQENTEKRFESLDSKIDIILKHITGLNQS